MKKNSKKIIIIGIIALSILCIGIIFLFYTHGFDSDVEEITNDYVMYLKFTDIIKIDYKEKYSLCGDEICVKPNTQVVDYKILKKDTDINYDNLEIVNKSLSDAISIVELFWNSEEFTVYVSQKDKQLNLDELQNKLNKEIKILKYTKEEDVYNNDEMKTYSVIFNSNGGSFVESQIVKEGQTIKKPTSPTRKGYTFINWTLNNEEYDFDEVLTSDIVLLANWKKEKVASPKEETTTTSPNKKAESTIDKINLNDYPTTSIAYVNYTQPIGYYFITNFDEIFPTLAGKKSITIGWDDEDIEYCDIKFSAWNEAFSKLNFNASQEKKTKEALEKIENKKYKGIKLTITYGNELYSNDTHMINYKYEYLTISKKPLTTLYNGIENTRNNLNKELNDLFSSAIKVTYPGYGVYGKHEGGILNEEMCQEYNFVCDRW